MPHAWHSGTLGRTCGGGLLATARTAACAAGARRHASRPVPLTHMHLSHAHTHMPLPPPCAPPRWPPSTWARLSTLASW